MAILTALGPNEIERVARDFGVDVVDAEGVLAGSVNTSFRVVDGDGRRFWLRVYEEQDHTGALREARLLARLAASGVATPAPIAFREEAGGAGERRYVATVRDKPVCLFPFVEGNHRCQASVARADVEAVGRELARVHLVGQAFAEGEDLTVGSRFSIAELRMRLSGLPRDLPPEVNDARRLLGDALDALEPTVTASSVELLPLIHGDLFRDNVLFTDAGVTLLDFESASIGSAAFDLMVTLLAWCFGDDLDHDLCRALLAGYQAARRLTDAEIADLSLMGRLACVRFAITRITDYELRPRGVGVYKDYRRFLARLAALDRIGAGLPEHLGVHEAVLR